MRPIASPWNAAHPRSRGENPTAAATSTRPKGSSPLTRGKPGRIRARRRGTRLIPAHAGKTPGGDTGVKFAAAHPRSRGENSRLGAGITWTRGSSPLTRGKRELLGCGRVVPGLIPAHAGKTYSPRMRPESTRAHPRSRGENLEDHLRRTEAEGSSPLTRGKLDCPVCRVDRLGLIPAHAGKTGPDDRAVRQSRAHPRSRGENGQALGCWA